jgi:hypothetical protein
VARKALEGPGTVDYVNGGRPWKDRRHRVYKGLRPINTAFLFTVDSVL